jgi:hypothetical protein
MLRSVGDHFFGFQIMRMESSTSSGDSESLGISHFFTVPEIVTIVFENFKT